MTTQHYLIVMMTFGMFSMKMRNTATAMRNRKSPTLLQPLSHSPSVAVETFNPPSRLRMQVQFSNIGLCVCVCAYVCVCVRVCVLETERKREMPNHKLQKYYCGILMINVCGQRQR